LPAWAPTTAGAADGDLRQAEPCGREKDRCNPYLERAREDVVDVVDVGVGVPHARWIE